MSGGWKPPAGVWLPKRERPGHDPTILRTKDAEVEVLVEGGGHRWWWRGVILRAADDVRQSVEIRPAGCASSIEVNVDQVLQCVPWARPRHAGVMASIERLHRERLGEGER